MRVLFPPVDANDLIFFVAAAATTADVCCFCCYDCCCCKHLPFLLIVQLGIDVLTREKSSELKRRLGYCLDSGNELLGMEVSPRSGEDGARIMGYGDGDEGDSEECEGPHHLFLKVGMEVFCT